MGDAAFGNCSSLRKIDLPSSLTALCDDAFRGCGSLQKINLPSSLTTLGDYAFMKCSSLQKIDLPPSLTTLGDSAFEFCSSLKEINGPPSLKRQFKNCEAVYRSYSAALPADEVSSADFKAKGNTALRANNFSEAIEHYTSAINIDGANHVYYSSRSAAYLSKGDRLNALKDANSCISLKPKFANGYSKKGAALHELKRYNDSISAYEAGLVECPGDKMISSGLDSVKKQKEREGERVERERVEKETAKAMKKKNEKSLCDGVHVGLPPNEKLPSKPASTKIKFTHKKKIDDNKFLHACEQGNLKMVQDFIGNGANVNAKDQEHGYTGLHVASKYGHNPIIKCLIVNDARIDEKDNKDRTPLMSAANANHPLAIKTLLLSGANEKIKDNDDNTAFDKSTNKDVKDVLMPNSAFLQIVSAHKALNSKNKDTVQESMELIRDLVQNENTELLLFTDAHGDTLVHQVIKANPTLDNLNYLEESPVMKAFNEDFHPLVTNVQIQVMKKNENLIPFNLKSFMMGCDWTNARVIIAEHKDIFFGSIIGLLYCCILIGNGYWRQSLIILPLFVVGRESIRQCIPYDKNKKIFKVENNTLKVLQIVPIKEIFQFPGNNMLLVRDAKSDKDNFHPSVMSKSHRKKNVCWIFKG